MAKSRTDVYQMYRVAKMYYQDNLTQQEIAERECISRSQISRYLLTARTEGIVRIEVSLPDDIPLSTIQNTLQHALKLKSVRIVPVPVGCSEDDAIDLVANEAAQYLHHALRGCRTIGIGWGRTLYRTSTVLPVMAAESSATFVPLIGASGTDNPSLQINAILDHVASQFRGHSYFVNVPAFRSSDLRLSDLEKTRLKKLHHYWSSLDAAVIGIATWKGANTVPVSEITDRERSLQGRVAVGEILSQFYQEDGSVFSFSDGYQLTAFDIRKFSSVPKVFCIAANPEKAQALLVGAKNQYYNELVVDSITARELFNLVRS